MAKIQAFYNILRLGEEVEATNPVMLTLREITEDVFPLLKEDNEYLGLIDNRGTTLQMMYDDESDQFWIEVPRADLNGSYGKHLDYDDAYDLLRATPIPFPPEGFDGFEFEKW